MGLFDFFKGIINDSNEENDFTWKGDESMDCPRCGQPMSKKYSYSGWWCNNCHAGLYDDDDDGDDESLSVYDAADIWRSNGEDEDYTFGYSEDELEDALK